MPLTQDRAVFAPGAPGRRRLSVPLSPAPPPALPVWQRVLFILIVAYGTLLRTWDLTAVPDRVDEAESSLNAMTILQHGVPSGHYLGLPIFENVLTLRDTTDPEFEFKDSSYSPRDLAIYHGWLPLYSIAAAFTLFDIHPDQDTTNLRVIHSAQDIRRRTLAGRLPGVLFGLVFMAAMYFAGKALYGPDAAWAALAVAAVCSPAVEAARQARYYSALLAVSALGAWALWRVVRHSRCRDYVACGVVISLAFYTHLVSFAIMCAAVALLLPALYRHRHGARKILLLGALVALCTVPWLLLTGFLRCAYGIPRVIGQFQWPGDFLTYPWRELPFTLVAVSILVMLLAFKAFPGRFDDRLVRPFRRGARALYFLAAWALIGFLVFIFAMPAASYFFQRMTITLLAPALLFGAVAFAAAGRLMLPRFSAPLAAGLFVGFMLCFNGARLWGYTGRDDVPAAYGVVERMRDLHLVPGTRLFATPNNHLVLTFYSGIPVADVAPVRKAFLDQYPGRVIIFEAGPRYDPLVDADVQGTAAGLGLALSPDRVRWVQAQLQTYGPRRDLQSHVAEVSPASTLTPAQEAFLQPFVSAQQAKTRRSVQGNISHSGSLMFRGYDVASWDDWWPVFFYRFCEPDARRGAGLNYYDRIHEAHATVLVPEQWVLYDCPPRPDPRSSERP